MNTRALLALMVLVGILPIQNGAAQFPGRAGSGTSSFFLDCNGTSPYGLVVEEPPLSRLDIANNSSAEFWLDGISGPYQATGGFGLNLSVSYINGSGLELTFMMLVDSDGDGTAEASVRFPNWTSSAANGTERIARDADDITGALGDIANGTLRLFLNRTDLHEGLLSILGGAGVNASILTIPYQVNASAGLPPVADAGFDVSRGRPGIPVSFHGSGTDPDGAVVSYHWEFGDGANASGPNVTHAYNVSGNYTVRLVIQDDDGTSASDSLNVRINYPPRMLSIPYTRNGNSIGFRASASDPDKEDTLSFRWDFGDGNLSNTTQPVHAYALPGNYTARCTVFDSWGDNDTMTVNVSLTNQPPVIASMGAKSTATPGERIHFQPSAYDPELDNLTYLWDFGDGGHSRDPSPYHTYPDAGMYHVVLSVSDGFSNTTSSLYLKVAATTNETMSSSVIFGYACLAVIGIVVIVAIIVAISRTKPSQAPSPYYGYQGAPPGAPYLPPPSGAPYYGGPPMAPTPGYGVPEPMRQPLPPPPPRAPRAPPGSCPRCGSVDLQVFGDGHSKCNNCKKIIYTG